MIHQSTSSYYISGKEHFLTKEEVDNLKYAKKQFILCGRKVIRNIKGLPTAEPTASEKAFSLGRNEFVAGNIDRSIDYLKEILNDQSLSDEVVGDYVFRFFNVAMAVGKTNNTNDFLEKMCQEINSTTRHLKNSAQDVLSMMFYQNSVVDMKNIFNYCLVCHVDFDEIIVLSDSLVNEKQSNQIKNCILYLQKQYMEQIISLPEQSGVGENRGKFKI